MNPFTLVRLPVLADAQQRVAAEPGARMFRAGGIDVLDRLKEGLDTPQEVVDLSAAADAAPMRAITKTSTGWSIGALVTLAQLASYDDLPPQADGVRQAALGAASPGIRNAATVGGNLLQRPRCWYFRDREIQCLKKGGAICYAAEGENRYHAVLGGGPSYIVHPSSLGAPLLAGGVRVRIRSAGGDERVIPLAQLFSSPSSDPTREHTLLAGDVLLSVEFPIERGEHRSAYVAAKQRNGYDWPLVEAAVSLALEDSVMRQVSVTLGHVAPIPWDAPAAAKVLEGQPPSTELFARAAEAALEGARALSQNAYKIPLGQGLVRKALHAATDIPLPE